MKTTSSLLSKAGMCIFSLCMFSCFFTSCLTDYGDEIDELRSTIDKTVNRLDSLIQNGNYVTNVVPIAGGFTIYFQNGQSYPITSGTNGTNGANGADGADGVDGLDGTVWTISENGFWEENGVETTHSAVGIQGPPGRDGTDITIEDGYWVIDGVKTEFEANGAPPSIEIKDGYWFINDEPTGVKAEGTDGTTWEIDENGYWVKDGEVQEYLAYYPPAPSPTIDEATGYWIVYVWDPDTKTYEPTILEGKMATGAYIVEQIDFWELHIRKDTGEWVIIELPKAPDTPRVPDTFSMEFLGFTSGQDLTAPLSLGALQANNLALDYWYIDSVAAAYNNDKDTLWMDKGKEKVEKGEVLDWLKSANTYAIVKISPATVDVPSLTFTLINSQDTVPIDLGDARKISPLLTRSNSDNGLYAIPFRNFTGVYDTDDTDFTAKFPTDALYALSANGVISNYGPGTITVTQGGTPATEGMVWKVGGVVATVEQGAQPVFNAGSLDTYFLIEFDSPVYDYYVETLSGNDIEGLEFDSDSVGFKLTVPKIVELNVYKLHIDGKVYVEKIRVSTL